MRWTSILLLCLASPVHAQPSDDDVRPPRARTPVDLIALFNLGFGLPTGMLGASLEGRYGPIGLDVGGGISLGGPQLMANLWVHLFDRMSTGDLALGVGYSTGDVSSRGDTGGLFGPDRRYSPAHWVNLSLCPTLKLAEDDGSGLILRGQIGAMVNLAPAADDTARIMPFFGIGVGYDFAL